MSAPRVSTLLNRCCYLTLDQVSQLHAQVLVNGLHHLRSHLLRHTLNSPSSNDSLSSSTANYINAILHNLPNQQTHSWSHTVRFFTQHKHFEQALSLYVQMQRQGIRPLGFAVNSALRSCVKTVDKFCGMSIHAQACYTCGFCGDGYVTVGVVDFYAKVGEIESARKVFDEMGERRSVVLWNVLLSGYMRVGDFEMGRKVFEEMEVKDVVSWNAVVSGYASAGYMEEAFEFFQRMPEKNSASWNALISGYVECGDMEAARRVFDVMPQKNSVSWITMIGGYSKRGGVESAGELFETMLNKDLLAFNAMTACYAQNGRAMEALKLFNEMLKPDVGIRPNNMTLTSVISACSQIGHLKFGFWVESLMKKLGIYMDDCLATALVDMYAKCGNFDRAYELFHGLRNKDLVAYSAMILGCGINGKANDAIKLFKEMIGAQIRPNLLTFSGLLTACNHGGFVEEGYQCFKSMKDYGLVPTQEHYAIMVDLLGRAGWLEEAYQLIKDMPVQPHAGVWGALLLACRVHNNVELGQIAAQHCFDLEPDTTGYSSLLSNIYASTERWNDVERLRMNMIEKGRTKIPGYSWMELS